MRPRHKRLLVAGLSLLPALVLADLCLTLFAIEDGLFFGRPLPPFGPTTTAEQKRWVENRLAERPADKSEARAGIFDAELGWTYQANSKAGVRFNSMGARGTREYSREKPDGVTRVICFGDSFTFCAEVGNEETWQAQLEARHPDFEVINFGVSGYGTGQALLRFRRRGTDLGANVVCIGLYLENIGRNVNRYRPLWWTRTHAPSPKPRFVLDGGELKLVPQPFQNTLELAQAVDDGSVLATLHEHEHWAASDGLSFLQHSSFWRLASAYREYTRRNARDLWLDVEGEPFRVTVAILDRFHREALEAGARAAPVILFPMRQELEGLLATDDRFWSELCRELDRRSIPYIDVAMVLADAHRAQTELTDVMRFYTGGHLSGEANGLLADALHEWIGRNL